jgi:hypothetical protein
MNNDLAIAEYESVKGELLFRLKAQQDIISFSLVVLGSLAPILGLTEIIPPYIILTIMLIGPIICVLLQLVYIKHHIWITLDLRFIDYELGDDTSTGLGLFGKRGKYYRDNLYNKALPNIFSAIVAFAEGSFPTLVGVLYLVLFVYFWWSNNPTVPLNLFGIFLAIWFLLDIFILILAIIAGIITRYWNYRYGRKQDVIIEKNDHGK